VIRKLYSVYAAIVGKAYLEFRGFRTFFSTWMDVNFTGLIVARGSYDAAAGRYTFVGETPDFDHPGKSIPLREVLTRQDDDHFTYAYYETRDGREAEAVRLDYTRVR